MFGCARSVSWILTHYCPGVSDCWAYKDTPTENYAKNEIIMGLVHWQLAECISKKIPRNGSMNELAHYILAQQYAIKSYRFF